MSWWWRAVAVLFPPVLLSLLLARWGVDLPYWDQFALVPHLEARATGAFRVADLWTPHNEHRLWVPQAIMLTLAAWSGWNVLWELWFQVGLALSTLALVVLLLARRDRAVHPLVLLLVSLMVFSPVQWRNWIWGWQIQIFLVVLSAVATLWLLARIRRPWLRFASAALTAGVGSLSFANGLLLWPLAVPMVAWGGPRDTPGGEARRTAWGQTAAWLLLGAGVWTAYFYDFVPGIDQGPAAEGLLRQLLHFGAYVVLYLAAPLLRFYHPLALWGGLVLVAAALAVVAHGVWDALRRRDADAARCGLLWWTLSAFALASACITALGRLDMGIGQALASRYVTLGNLFWLGLVGWLVSRRREPASLGRRRVAAGLIAVALVLLVVNAAHGVYHFRRDAGARSDLRQQILQARSGEELRAVQLDFLYPSAEEAASHLETLRALRLGPYRDRR